MTTGSDQQTVGEASVSIGALARATQIPAATLRTWERRYGYPVPKRRPSGHRVYSTANIERLRRIADALARGHRAADVVPAGDEQLRALLADPPPQAPVGASRPGGDDTIATIRRFDGDALSRQLTDDWAAHGPVAFLTERVAPLVTDVGERWARGDLDVAHEHFFAESVGGLLRSLRQPFDRRAHGPSVVLATLPGELHALGLQMAALALATTGWRVVNLGPDVPREQIVKHATGLGARAVGIGVSAATAAGASELTALRAALPRTTELLIGGSGAPSIDDATAFDDLEALHEWARNRA